MKSLFVIKHRLLRVHEIKNRREDIRLLAVITPDSSDVFIGVLAGVVVALGCLVLLLGCYIYRRRRRERELAFMKSFEDMSSSTHATASYLLSTRHSLVRRPSRSTTAYGDSCLGVLYLRRVSMAETEADGVWTRLGLK